MEKGDAKKGGIKHTIAVDIHQKELAACMQFHYIFFNLFCSVLWSCFFPLLFSLFFLIICIKSKLPRHAWKPEECLPISLGKLTKMKGSKKKKRARERERKGKTFLAFVSAKTHRRPAIKNINSIVRRALEGINSGEHQEWHIWKARKCNEVLLTPAPLCTLNGSHRSRGNRGFKNRNYSNCLLGLLGRL